MIRGVLFDMDGLMFDTERIGHQGWKHAGRMLDIEVPDAVIEAGRGMSVPDSRVMYRERLGQELDYDALRTLRVAYAEDIIAREGLPVKPGLRQLLEHLRAVGIPAALATATARETALRYLTMAGVDGFFTAAVCGDEVAHAKPAPDIFLAAAGALGVPASECLVLEDSPNGLRAAKAAGCKAVVVPDITPIPPESEGLWAASAVTLADVIPLLAQL